LFGDRGFDKFTILLHASFEEFGFKLLFLGGQKFEIAGNILFLGFNDNLNGETKGVKKASIGVNNSVLFFFGEEAKVDGGGFDEHAANTCFEDDKIILDGLDVKVILGSGDNDRIGHS